METALQNALGGNAPERAGKKEVRVGTHDPREGESGEDAQDQRRQGQHPARIGIPARVRIRTHDNSFGTVVPEQPAYPGQASGDKGFHADDATAKRVGATAASRAAAIA